MVRANRSAVLLLFLGFSFAFAFPATEHRQEVKELIAARQLDAAEKIIVSELVTTHHDPVWVTELAALCLGQGRTSEALALIGDAEKLGGVTASRAQLAGLARDQPREPTVRIADGHSS
jgi:hypothetical protein